MSAPNMQGADAERREAGERLAIQTYFVVAILVVAVPLATAVAESDTYWADIQAQTNSNAVLVEAVSVDIEGGEY